MSFTAGEASYASVGNLASVIKQQKLKSIGSKGNLSNSAVFTDNMDGFKEVVKKITKVNEILQLNQKNIAKELTRLSPLESPDEIVRGNNMFSVKLEGHEDIQLALLSDIKEQYLGDKKETRNSVFSIKYLDAFLYQLIKYFISYLIVLRQEQLSVANRILPNLAPSSDREEIWIEEQQNLKQLKSDLASLSKAYVRLFHVIINDKNLAKSRTFYQTLTSFVLKIVENTLPWFHQELSVHVNSIMISNKSAVQRQNSPLIETFLNLPLGSNSRTKDLTSEIILPIDLYRYHKASIETTIQYLQSKHDESFLSETIRLSDKFKSDKKLLKRLIWRNVS